MLTALEILDQKLRNAATPEEIFGTAEGSRDEQLEQVKHTFRGMAMVAHPDRAGTAETFKLLETWRERAEQRIRAGLYGKTSTAPIITRRGIYLPGKRVTRGDYYTIYECMRTDRPAPPGKLLLKIVRDPRDNDLLEKEAERLTELAEEPIDSFSPPAAIVRYAPAMIDSFLASEGTTQRRALIVSVPTRSASFTTIRESFPAGLNPRDAAWIFNRMLEGLWYLHRRGLVQGAVLPANLFADIENHGLRFTEWAAAVPVGQPLPLMSNAYAAWYPDEVRAREATTPATDLFMAARCMVWLLGGDPITAAMPATVPVAMQRFITSCLVPASRRRPNDAGALREEFGDLLKNLYGKPAFRPLAIPA